MKRILGFLVVLFPHLALADRASDLIGLAMNPSLAKEIGNAIGDANLIYTASQYTIKAQTSDASDSKGIALLGGGAIGSTGSRGANVFLHGNEYSGAGGILFLDSGSASGAIIGLRAFASNGAIEMYTGGNTLRWSLNSSGSFVNDATSGGDVVLQKVGSTVRQGVATAVVAAGSAITDATDLTSVYTDVATVGASEGVQLFDPGIGSVLFVKNSGANALAVYPPSGSGTINGGSAGASVAIATGATGVFYKMTATAWLAFEAAAA